MKPAISRVRNQRVDRPIRGHSEVVVNGSFHQPARARDRHRITIEGIGRARGNRRAPTRRPACPHRQVVAAPVNCLHCHTACRPPVAETACTATANARRWRPTTAARPGWRPLPRWQHPALCSDDPIVGAAARRAVQLGQAHDGAGRRQPAGWMRLLTNTWLTGATDAFPLNPPRNRVQRTKMPWVPDEIPSVRANPRGVD